MEAGRLRFDFNHFAGLSEEELDEVERLANARVIHNDQVSAFEATRDEAEEMGALAFFGDKYGEQVRVVQIGDFSLELCGGTHTPTSGQVGPLIVVSESSIGANARRIEALSGEAAYDYLAGLRRRLMETGRVLGVPPEEVPRRTKALVDRARQLADEIEAQAERDRLDMAAELASEAGSLGDSRFVVSVRMGTPADELRRLAVQVRERLGSGVVVLGSSHDGKGALVATVTRDLVERGISAGDLIAPAAKELGGGGSRDPELAQAGGPRGDRIATALDAARNEVTRRLAEV